MTAQVEARFADSYEKTGQIVREIKKVILNKDDVISKILMTIFANGHILLEDVPGVGKTTLALALSKTMDLDCKRLQFTPDVMPSDIIGFTMYNKQSGQFEYRPGAALCNLFLADEINRTSSRSQSALLELMEERKATVDGVTHVLPSPYFVIATQNPIGSAGTQLLPESQLDRFMVCLSMGYPDEESEIAILKGRERQDPLNLVETVIGRQEILSIQKLIETIYIDDSVYHYLLSLVTATRKHDSLKMGLSPRGSLALMRMSKSCAFLHGRDYVTPLDLQEIFFSVCTHRIVLTAKAKASGTAEEVLSSILEEVPMPGPLKNR
jgi:MoxR-like ATPase